MYNHRKDLPSTGIPEHENLETELNDSVLDYQNGTTKSEHFSYDYSMAIPLDQVPFTPTQE